MGDGDADAAQLVDAEPLDLGGEVERADRGAGGEVVGGEEVGGNDPDDLELDPVGILRVEALGGAVVAGADERASIAEHAGEPLQLAQRVDLPGEVVQPDRRAPGIGRGGARADLEQAEVVVVGRVRGLQERGTRELAHDAEAEHVAVEAASTSRRRGRRGPRG